MASQWFECKVRFMKTMETGLMKKVTETYLVDALTFTEAEERFLSEIESYVSGEFEVSDIKKARIAELFESLDTTDDRWYKAVVAYIQLDEKTGAEKRTNQTVLVQAKDFFTAVKNTEKAMKGTLGEWVVVSLAETAIMDIYRYKVPEDKPEQEAADA
ncbi:MAG: DUF4494 domain-containing protein [Bacteroidaceae bacterium]|nr:DUF4494 domain-containing protein [Bacteroidaceae bacterium]